MAKRPKVDVSTDERAGPYLKELGKETDRGAALVGAAILETMLQHVLEATFVEGNWNSLFEPNQLLGDFGAKIDVAAAMGLIGKTERAELHRIRKIRNEFGHNLDCTHFTDAPVAAMTGSLFNVSKSPTTSRGRFAFSFAMLFSLLMRRIGSAGRLEPPVDVLESFANGK